jgi:Fe-S cluster biogenesis protein NfuA
MFIQTETTPNPQTLKFLPGKPVMHAGSTAFFTRKEEAAEKSELAATLFEVEGINAIFFGGDFISITKSETSQWDGIKAPVLSRIMDHFVAGKPVMLDTETTAADSGELAEEDSDIVRTIKELIQTRVRPAVAQDGGDIIFKGFEEKSGTVQLELHGSCSGCPSSTITLKDGIENMLKHYVPEVKMVEAVAE